MYVLYQLNEKNELTISFHIFFHLTYALPFLKKVLAGYPRRITSYLQATPRLWNLHRQNRGKRACFQQISNCVTYWNAQTKRELESGIHSNKTTIHYIEKYWNQVYFINIRLFNRMFCKNGFYSFILLQGVMIKILYFQ